MNVDRISIESDERGFELHVFTDEEDFIFNIQEVAETLYDQAKARIGPWLYERDMARATMPPSYDAREAYDLSDPKHPDFHSIHADIYDSREGK